MRKREVQLRLFDQHFLTIIFSNFRFLKAIFCKCNFHRNFSFKIANNVPMLELVAAWEPSFFQQGGAKLGKRNGQFTEKLAMKF